MRFRAGGEAGGEPRGADAPEEADEESGPVLAAEGGDSLLWEDTGSIARGYLTLVRGDTAGALALLGSVRPLSHNPFRSLTALTEAQVLAASGDLERAAAAFDRVPINPAAWPNPVFVLAQLGRARVYERLGRLAEAAKSYAVVQETWRHADPVLQSYVEEARLALRRIVGEPRH